MGATAAKPIDTLCVADECQLSHQIAMLLHLGVYTFGDHFMAHVERHGDPNSNHGSGLPVLGGYT